MIVSQKEKNLFAVTVVFMLFAFVAFSMRKQIDAYRVGNKTAESRLTVLNDYKNVIAQKDLWNTEYEKRASLMPVFGLNDDVRTHWNRTLNDLAATNQLKLIQLDIGRERIAGDVYELPIECKNWEGELESLVSFLHAIHAQGAMLDIRKLTIRPGSNKSALLRGTFTLYCAYMRTDNKE